MSSSQHKPLPQVPPSINKASQLPSTAEVFSADKVHDILCNQASWAQLSEDVIKLVLAKVGVPVPLDKAASLAALQQHIQSQVPVQWSQRSVPAPVGTLLKSCQSNARKQPSVALFAAASPSLQGKASAPDTLYLYGGQQGHIQESQRANTQQQQRKPKPKLRLDEMDEAYREAVKSWIGSDDDGSDVSESDEEDQDEDDDIPEVGSEEDGYQAMQQWLAEEGLPLDDPNLAASSSRAVTVQAKPTPRGQRAQQAKRTKQAQQQQQSQFMLWMYSNGSGGWVPCCCPYAADVHGMPAGAVGYSVAVRQGASGVPALWVFGGVDAGGKEYLDTLHCCSLPGRRSSWHEVAQTGDIPTPRAFHRTAVDSATDRMYLFGAQCCADAGGADIPGYDPASAAHVYCFDFKQNTWTQLHVKGAAPDPGDVEALHVHHNQLLVLCGGQSKGVPGMAVHVLDLEKHVWSCLACKGAPLTRVGPAVAVHKETAWLVQGGRAPDGSSLSAALLFDFASQSWSCLAPTNWASVPSTPAAAADLPQTARHVAAPYNGTVVIFTAATGALSFGDSRVPSSAGTLVCLWQSVQRLADPKGAPAHCPAPRMLYDVPTAQMVRCQIARCLLQGGSKKLVFKANDAPRSVSCPAAVLSLYSTFFDDMFQDMVQDSDMDAVPVTIGGSQELSGLQLMLQCVFGARHTGHFDALQLIRLFRLAHQYDMRFIAAECVASLHVVTLTADVVAPMLQLTMDVGHCKELAGLQERCMAWMKAQSKGSVQGLLCCLQAAERAGFDSPAQLRDQALAAGWSMQDAVRSCPLYAGGWPALLQYALELHKEQQTHPQAHQQGGPLLRSCMEVMRATQSEHTLAELRQIAELCAAGPTDLQEACLELLSNNLPAVTELLPLLDMAEAHGWPGLKGVVLRHLGSPEVNSAVIRLPEFRHYAKRQPDIAKQIIGSTNPACGKAASLSCSLTTMARCAALLPSNHHRRSGQQVVANLAVCHRPLAAKRMTAWRSPKRKRNLDADKESNHGLVYDT